jgi:hypothetical protein
LENYGTHEEGNTLSYQDFQQFLDEEYKDVSFQEHLLPRMKDLIIDSILSVKGLINPSRIQPAFELFGYDFMIDEDFRVWLIEINTNPYLGLPNKLIKKS